MSNDTMKMGQLFPTTEDNLPKVGQKFIALHKDGSGGACLQRVEGGYKLPDGDVMENIWHLADEGYDEWLPLPDDYTLSFEMWGE